jgi:hypothetical protein
LRASSRRNEDDVDLLPVSHRRRWWQAMALLVCAVAAACGGSGDGLSVTMVVDGIPVSRPAMREGEELTVNVADGSRIELRASEPADWSDDFLRASPRNESVMANVRSFTLVNDGVLSSRSVFEATARNRPGRPIRLLAVIDARRFLPVPRQPGDSEVWRSEFVRAGEEPQTRTYRHDTTHFTAPGIAFVVTSRLDDGKPIAYTEFDGDDNAVSRAFVSYDADGNDYPADCRFAPPVAEFVFPLHVEQRWQMSWRATDCIDLNSGSGMAAGEVEAYETVSVPAGTFEALRIHLGITPADGLAGGLVRTDRRCWWSDKLGRLVKCQVSLLDFSTGELTARTTDEMISFTGMAVP